MLPSKLALYSIIFGFTAVASTGCGDDDNNNPPGDGGCTGHLCGDGGAGDPTLNDPEGGNIIFEYIYFDTELQAAFGLPNGVTTANRVMAYFMSAHSPDKNPLPTPGVCVNLVATKGWPMFVGDPHTDVDVGTLTITGPNEAGADQTLTIPKLTDMNDAIGRPHDVFYQVVNPNAGDFIKTNASYDVTFGGAGDIPATTYTDAIFMAEEFTVNEPDLEDNGPLVAGTDFTVKWTPTTTSGANDEVLGVTWLVDGAGSPTHMCATLLSEGQFTIPGSAITEYQAIAQARGLPTNKMILLRNAIIHRLEWLPPANTRRIDMLSVMCWAQLMDVQ